MAHSPQARVLCRSWDAPLQRLAANSISDDVERRQRPEHCATDYRPNNEAEYGGGDATITMVETTDSASGHERDRGEAYAEASDRRQQSHHCRLLGSRRRQARWPPRSSVAWTGDH